MGDEQISRLAGVMKRQRFLDKDRIIRQGDPGHRFFVLHKGECVATIGDPEVKRYETGDIYGEKALLEDAPRGATISAAGHVSVYEISRTAFEERLGSLSQLQAEQYLADPRKLIADFYRPGGSRGPRGTLEAQVKQTMGEPTQGFAVYRPCSRDSIAKMLGTVGVGKGLNVKGKSAQRNRLPGFVPFVQISDNGRKMHVENSPKAAQTALSNILDGKRGAALAIARREIDPLDGYAPGVYGLHVPEPLMHEAYTMMADLSPGVGWETGRVSEPAFMEVNLHATRGGPKPTVALHQYDQADLMNPLGLLIAYAGTSAKPVVSDFDTFLFGSRGAICYEVTPEKQVELTKWSLRHTQDLLGTLTESTWTSRWLDVLKEEARNGFHPELPKYGFSEATP